MTITILLLGLLLILAVLTLHTHDLLRAVIFLAVFSLLSAMLFFYLHAPDVALTEAAVGAGVSTLILIWIIHTTEQTDDT